MVLAGQKSLFANGITFILFGFYTVYSSLFLALGKGAAGFFLGACRQGVCFVPVILLLPMVWGMNGILYAQPIADVISVVITVFMALHLHRELSMAEKQVMSNSDIMYFLLTFAINNSNIDNSKSWRCSYVVNRFSHTWYCIGKTAKRL